MRLPRLRIRYADVAATLALVMAGGGTAYAVTMAPPNSVNTAAIQRGAVTMSKLRNAAVTPAKLRADAVRGPKILDHSVTKADLTGADITGSISLALPASSCGQVNLNVPGAAVGDTVLFSWTGGSMPAHVVAGPGRVSAADTILMVMCNEGGSPVSLSGQGVRVMTFR